MNSDPYDSAAWRTFGMLDADESAIFDEAMRHDPVLRSAWLEMDRLSAAVAASTVTPVVPRAGQLERLQNRLGLYPVKRTHWWFGVSGWAAAAVFALLLVFSRDGISNNKIAAPVVESAPVAANPVNPVNPVTTMPKTPPMDAPAMEGVAVNDEPPAEQIPAVSPIADPESKATVKVETKRLIQEIEVLRDSLEKFHERDRVLFEPVPGIALPIVMTMAPPGTDTHENSNLAHLDDQVSITAMLGDAVKSANTRTNTDSALASAPSFNSSAIPPLESVQLPEELPAPSAIPIYDAARDVGTLVVSHLPMTSEGEVYNLWVNTQSGDRPIYVGSLPQNSETGVDSFDFSLGSTMVLPSGFILTKDPVQTPSTPTEANTVLQGPPAQ